MKGAVVNPPGFWTRVVKQVDEPVWNSEVMQDDDELYFYMEANHKYIWNMYLFVDSPAAQDIEYAFNYPAAAWGRMGKYDEDLTVALDTDTTIATTGNEQRSHVVQGHVQCDATPGNLQLEWAQKVAAAADAKILKGSFIEYRDVT